MSDLTAGQVKAIPMRKSLRILIWCARREHPEPGWLVVVKTPGRVRFCWLLCAVKRKASCQWDGGFNDHLEA
jgi:hypothetical protein